MLLRLIVFLIFLSFFSLCFGCSQTPKPSSHIFTTQKKLQATKHWKIIASDISAKIKNKIKKEKINQKVIKIINTDNSSFSRSFKSFLSTSLIKSGIDISNNPITEYTLDWSVQCVNHNANRSTSNFPGINTAVAMLGYGLYKVYDDSTDFAKVASTAFGLDIVKEYGETKKITLPDNEIILNVTLYKSNAVEFRSSNIYYINDLDVDHYHFTRDPIGLRKSVGAKNYTISD